MAIGGERSITGSMIQNAIAERAERKKEARRKKERDAELEAAKKNPWKHDKRYGVSYEDKRGNQKLVRIKD